MSTMQAFLWNLLLAVVWALASGSVTVGTLVGGFLAGLVTLYATRRAIGSSKYLQTIGSAARLLTYFVHELVVANLRVARDIITPRHRMRPAIVAIPLEAKTDGEITVLAGLITLTPGSLTLEVSEDRRTLYIHSMYTPDADRVRRDIKNGLEARLLKVLR